MKQGVLSIEITTSPLHWITNLFEQVFEHQANRITTYMTISNDDLVLLTVEDFV